MRLLTKRALEREQVLGFEPTGNSDSSVSLQAVEDLIAAGADLERADTKGHTPLHYAAGYGR